ncbi:MAG TPA: hypothetical protein VFG14_12505 [Chthoniobacteraceae bacterium]|nr:hypothetical protein [Chthoniobacteraceae bacterium]
MSLEEQLFETERGFWLEGESCFLHHLDESCLLVFPQSGEMHGVFSREKVASTATAPNRWRDLRMSNRQFLQIAKDCAIISYRADVVRGDGVPYAALISSAYAQKSDSWLLASHQHSPVLAD